MSPYVFAFASVLSIIPILLIFKITVERFKETAEDKSKLNPKVFKHFFLGVTLSAIIPLILIVYGFMNIETVKSIDELVIPAIIVILFVGFALFFIYLQRKFDVDEQLEDIINSFAKLTSWLIIPIPFASFILLTFMMP